MLRFRPRFFIPDISTLNRQKSEEVMWVEFVSWKCDTLDCLKIHLPAPEQLKMFLKKFLITTDIFYKYHDVAKVVRKSKTNLITRGFM